MSRQRPISALPDPQRNESLGIRQGRLRLIETIRHVRIIRFESYATSMDWIGTADHVGKAILRYYIGPMFKGHYAGAIVGAIASQLEQRPTEPVTLRPVNLADRFQTKPATICRLLERWRKRGLIEHEGRGEYRVTVALRDVILTSKSQSFESDDLIGADTPYTLAIRSAARRAYTISVLADWFGITRQSMHELCMRYGIEVTGNTTEPDKAIQQNLTGNTTEPDRPYRPEVKPEKTITRARMRGKGQDRTNRAGYAQRPLQERVPNVNQTADYLDRIAGRGKYSERGNDE